MNNKEKEIEERAMKHWCKFCKYGYGVLENGKRIIYCHLSYFNYPEKKDGFDTCENWEEEM